MLLVTQAKALAVLRTRSKHNPSQGLRNKYNNTTYDCTSERFDSCPITLLHPSLAAAESEFLCT